MGVKAEGGGRAEAARTVTHHEGKRQGGGYTYYGADALLATLAPVAAPRIHASPPRCLAAARHVHSGGVGPHRSEQLAQFALFTLHLRLHTHARRL